MANAPYNAFRRWRPAHNGSKRRARMEARHAGSGHRKSPGCRQPKTHPQLPHPAARRSQFSCCFCRLPPRGDPELRGGPGMGISSRVPRLSGSWPKKVGTGKGRPPTSCNIEELDFAGMGGGCKDLRRKSHQFARPPSSSFPTLPPWCARAR